MMSVQELEVAVAKLSKEELASFSLWFEQHLAGAWDREIERDILARRFDSIGERAIADHEAERSTPL